MADGSARRAGLLVLLVACVACGACSSSLPGQADGSKSTPYPEASTVPATSSTVASTTSSDPNGGPPHTSVTYPNPYAPSYDTVASLWGDSVFAVVGSLAPADATGSYHINLDRAVVNDPPRNQVWISPAEFAAGHLSVGPEYVFFLFGDAQGTCVTGGVRGMFTYDPASNLVTRIDQNPNSQIPRTQTLDQLSNAIENVILSEQGQPVTNAPPVCSHSATGI